MRSVWLTMLMVLVAGVASTVFRIVDVVASMSSILLVLTGFAMVLYSQVGIVVLVPLIGLLWQVILLTLAYAYLGMLGVDSFSMLMLGVSGLVGVMLNLYAFVKMVVEVLGGAKEARLPPRRK